MMILDIHTTNGISGKLNIFNDESINPWWNWYVGIRDDQLFFKKKNFLMYFIQLEKNKNLKKNYILM